MDLQYLIEHLHAAFDDYTSRLPDTPFGHGEEERRYRARDEIERIILTARGEGEGSDRKEGVADGATSAGRGRPDTEPSSPLAPEPNRSSSTLNGEQPKEPPPRYGPWEAEQPAPVCPECGGDGIDHGGILCFVCLGTHPDQTEADDGD